MHTTQTALLAILTLAGTGLADLRETSVFNGPYGVLGEGNPLNTTLTASFTGFDGGVPYTANGLHLTLDLTANGPITFARDTMLRVTPPAGPTFDLQPSDEYFYDTLSGVTVDVHFPFGVSPVGAWSFSFYQTFEFDGSVPDAYVSNVRISLQDRPPVELPAPVDDVGVLTEANVMRSTPDYSGADVIWHKLTLPQAASPETGFYLDVDTIGTSIAPGASGLANDTMMALFDANGFLHGESDDIFDDSGEVYMPESWLSFGDQMPRSHGGNPVPSNGFNGSLIAGDYYLAAGAFYMEFDHGFSALMNSLSTGGLLQVNIYSNFETEAPCSVADIGAAGGQAGRDNVLNNNDFIVFIDYFFGHDPVADMGRAGGEAGSDGAFDNNDFVVFIDHFFDGQAACNG